MRHFRLNDYFSSRRRNESFIWYYYNQWFINNSSYYSNKKLLLLLHFMSEQSRFIKIFVFQIQFFWVLFVIGLRLGFIFWAAGVVRSIDEMEAWVIFSSQTQWNVKIKVCLWDHFFFSRIEHAFEQSLWWIELKCFRENYYGAMIQFWRTFFRFWATFFHLQFKLIETIYMNVALNLLIM